MYNLLNHAIVSLQVQIKQLIPVNSLYNYGNVLQFFLLVNDKTSRVFAPYSNYRGTFAIMEMKDIENAVFSARDQLKFSRILRIVDSRVTDDHD